MCVRFLHVMQQEGWDDSLKWPGTALWIRVQLSHRLRHVRVGIVPRQLELLQSKACHVPASLAAVRPAACLITSWSQPGTIGRTPQIVFQEFNYLSKALIDPVACKADNWLKCKLCVIVWVEVFAKEPCEWASRLGGRFSSGLSWSESILLIGLSQAGVWDVDKGADGTTYPTTYPVRDTE
jgi:hypothetical protein